MPDDVRLTFVGSQYRIAVTCMTAVWENTGSNLTADSSITTATAIKPWVRDYGQSCITQWAKGAAAQGPQSQDKTNSHRIWSPSRHAVLHVCAVHGYCRLLSQCSFYPRGASSARVIAIIVCLCVCVSHAGIVSKRLNVGLGSRKQHHVIAQGL